MLLLAQDSDFLLRRLLDQFQVLFYHGFLDLWQRVLGAEFVAGLNQPTADNSGHTDLRGKEL